MGTQKLKKDTIKHLQEYVAYKIKKRGFENETLHERLLLIVEEIGELVKDCRHLSGMNVNQNSEHKVDVGEEVADVLNLLFAVAIKLNLNIEEEYRKKEKIVDGRFYKRLK